MLDEEEDELVEETDSAENSSFDEELKPEAIKKIKGKWNIIVGNNVEIIVSLLNYFYY